MYLDDSLTPEELAEAAAEQRANATPAEQLLTLTDYKRIAEESLTGVRLLAS